MNAGGGTRESDAPFYFGKLSSGIEVIMKRGHIKKNDSPLLYIVRLNQRSARIGLERKSS